MQKSATNLDVHSERSFRRWREIMTLSKATYPARVTFNQDPDKRGVIRVACQGLIGNDTEEIPVDVEPAPDWGWFYVPDVGELVEIEVIESSSEDEQHGQASIDNLDLRWRQVRYPNLEAEDEADRRPVNADFTSKNYGKRRGFATPGGHVFMFDDTEGDEAISWKWQNKAGQNAFVSFDKDGSFILQNKTGTMMFFDAKNGAMSIIDEHGNMVGSDEVGIKMIDKTGNVVELKEGAIIILGQSGVTISCKDAVIDAGNVEITGAAEAALLGTSFLPLLNAHTHPVTTAPGVTGVPTIPFPASILSTTVKVG